MTALMCSPRQSPPHGRSSVANDAVRTGVRSGVRFCSGRRAMCITRDLVLKVVAGGQATVAQKGTIMKSTMVLSVDTSDRRLWVDTGWPACDERLVTVAEAIAYRVGGANAQSPDLR